MPAMTANITKTSIDLGIVTINPDAMVRFYKDVVGLPQEGEMPMPGGGKMIRLLAGTSVIKIVTPAAAPPAVGVPGGIGGATGLRYWTITVSNLNDLAQRCADAGHKLAIKPREIRPGISIAMVEDPDGNWVEFLQVS